MERLKILKGEIKMENIVEINHKTVNLEQETESELYISPFGLYENKYCSKCQDYRGCLGLIDSTTMDLQESKGLTGDKAFDNMIKSMGGLTFSARFKMILDCARMRDIISNI
jgi:hypothetical protein